MARTEILKAPKPTRGTLLQPFEFLMILVSIVIGMGIAQLLAGVVRLLRGELKPYWIHTIWILYVFLMQLQYCWSLFNLKAQSDWVFGQLVGLLTPPILLFLVASLLFPAAGGEDRLSKFYYSTRKPIFGLIVLLLTYYSARGWMLESFVLRGSDVIRILGIGGFGVLFVSERRSIHGVISVIQMAVLFGFIGAFSYVLGDFRQ